MHRTASLLLLLLLLSAFGTPVAGGGKETYQYDPAGRLSRILFADGSVTTYEYDSLGNLVSVRPGRSGFPPSITEVEPTEMRAGSTARIRAKGQNLAEVKVIPPSTHFAVSDLVTHSDTLSFLLSVAVEAPPGDQVLSVANADGATELRLSILPPLPRLSVAPLPLALPDDGSVRQILVRLSRTDVVDRSVSLSTAHPAVAELLDHKVTVAAGAQEAYARIRGVSGGLTTLSLGSEGLESAVYSVYVTAAYGDVNTKFSGTLGIVVADAETSAPGSKHPGWSARLGVTLGASISGIDPEVLGTGATAARLTVRGIGLLGVEGVTLLPDEGLVTDDVEVTPDGTEVSFLLSMAVDAPLGARRVVLAGPALDYPPATPGADILEITPPAPEIESLMPIFAVRGATASPMIVRGRYLGGPLDVIFEPAQGIEVGTDLLANADGTKLPCRISVSPDAMPGERIVRVRTAGGTSSATPTAANRFAIVDEAPQSFAPLPSAPLGVVRGEDGPAPRGDRTETATVVGVALGPIVDDITPRSGVIGASLEVELRGSGLAEVEDAAFEPPDGLFLESLTADPLGEFVRLSLLIDASAPQIWHRVRLFNPTGEVPFVSASASQLLVTAPPPQITAVKPNTLQIGSGEQEILLFGEHFTRATEVSALPPDDLAIGVPSVIGNGTALSTKIRAAEGASIGLRTLRVTTPAGTSTATASPMNTFTLFAGVKPLVDPLLAPLVGVALVDEVGTALPVRSLPAAQVGIEVGPENSEAPQQLALAAAPTVDVALGPLAERIDAPPLAPGGTYTLRVLGQSLMDVDGAGIFPGLDVALGSPFASEDGQEVTLTLTVQPDAQPGARTLALVKGPLHVPFANPANAVLQLASGVPRIHSVQPIVAEPGDTFELVIRGHHLDHVLRVTTEPDDGLVFGTELSINADGTELRIRAHALEEASVGPCTVRVQTAGGTSTDEASPANTLTIY